MSFHRNFHTCIPHFLLSDHVDVVHLNGHKFHSGHFSYSLDNEELIGASLSPQQSCQWIPMQVSLKETTGSSIESEWQSYPPCGCTLAVANIWVLLTCGHLRFT